MAAYRRVDGFKSPAGWLPVRRDQLRAQLSVTSMGSLYLFLRLQGPVMHACVGLFGWHVWSCLIDRLFFEVCDAILLNYHWKEASLEQSKQLSSELGRTRDVYVGVDVFGRGCYGDGGFNTVEVEFCKASFISVFSWWPCVGSDASFWPSRIVSIIQNRLNLSSQLLVPCTWMTLQLPYHF